jgi:His-Xaa-Ser system radical SAM maturase HxsC
MILGVHGVASGIGIPVIGRVVRRPRAEADRRDHVLIASDGQLSDVVGYLAVLCEEPWCGPVGVPTVHSLPTSHLSEGDVVVISERGYVRTLYRRDSPHNFIFATDRCNSYCLMCSQPPRDADETGIVERHLRLIDLIDPETKELGITGGEPTLLGEGLIRMIAACRDRLPRTALHILSNGRAFANQQFARAISEVTHPDLMIGVPLYADVDVTHDFVVQSRGAFRETVRGLHRLGAAGVRVEIRVVVHRATVDRLPQLAEYIYRNLTFVSQVALMGLEITGFTIPNLDTLWIDPADYQHQLRTAAMFLAARGVRVAIYNHQLCTLDRELWPFAVRSISDWKNEYLPECERCLARQMCGGFFASAVERRRFSREIHPLTHLLAPGRPAEVSGP